MAQNRWQLAGSPRRLGRAFRLLTALVLSALLLNGCSRISLAYDWFFQGILTDYVHRYADLNRTQYRALNDRMGEFITWHRGSELTDYASFLRQLRVDLHQGELSAERLKAHIETGEQFFDRFVEAILPRVSPSLLALSDEQIQHMSSQFAESNQELRERWAESDMEERIERVDDRLQEWIGRLEPFQREAIERFLSRQAPVVDGRLQLRERWQAEFLELMSADLSLSQLNGALPRFFIDSNGFADEGYQRAMQQRQSESLVFAADFIASMTDRQRDRLSRRLQRYADEFDKLAASQEGSTD